MVAFVVNTRYKPARTPQIPSTFTLCTSSSHPYQNKGLANQNRQFLSPLFSHCCAHSLPQPLCFDMLHKNTRGEGVTPPPTTPSRIGMVGAPIPASAPNPLPHCELSTVSCKLLHRITLPATVIAAPATPRLQSFVCHTVERLSRSVMHEIRVHNTLSGKVEPFVPLKPGEIRMYTCGPTVYDYAHIGNFRTFVFQDILRRFLKLRGFKLTHVMNLTDVDDRIIANAAKPGVSIRDYTEKFIQAFYADCRTLSVESPEHWIRATDHIDDMVALIQRLRKNTYTYPSEGLLYYRIAKFKDYGKLSKID